MFPLAASAASAFFYAAYSIRNPILLNYIQHTRNLFVVAGVLTLSFAPYTLIMMKKTNDALAAKSNAVNCKD